MLAHARELDRSFLSSAMAFGIQERTLFVIACKRRQPEAHIAAKRVSSDYSGTRVDVSRMQAR